MGTFNPYSAADAQREIKDLREENVELRARIYTCEEVLIHLIGLANTSPQEKDRLAQLIKDVRSA